MDGLSETLLQVNQWWENEGNTHSASITALASQIDTHTQSIAEINNRSSGLNPLRYLGNAWTRSTQGASLSKEKKKLKRQKETLESTLSIKASNDGDLLLLATAGQDDDIKQRLTAITTSLLPLEEARNVYTSVQAKTNDLLKIIQNAWEQADKAESWETYDMVGNNKGFTLLSHFETSDAKEHLDKVVGALEEYKGFMATIEERLPAIQLTTLRGQAIEDMAELDLWAGLSGIDVISVYTSWKNLEKLGKAKEKLEDLKEKITPISTRAEEFLLETQEDYNCHVSRYVDLRSEVVNSLALPKSIKSFIPRNSETETMTRTPSRPFQL